MKKIIFIPVVALFTIATTVTSCKPSPKEEAAQENLQEAKEDVKDAREDLAEAKKQANKEEWESFKNDMNVAIEKNNLKIAELKEEIKKSGKKAGIEYNKKIDTLSARNQVLKEKIANYKNDANADWESFKREFNHDMDELGHALKDITVDNKK
ncbi:hypothetical protein [Flavobacterium sp.]|uniref:hypothetical protein n=1 Tax=Flavobacterium sp. TaxID=239 RepID=UPI002BA760CA|nr:hypothetical protein [Flavobacterium sp.]HSD06343.1 hypothetical protein [Flavobacterium sp.]